MKEISKSSFKFVCRECKNLKDKAASSQHQRESQRNKKTNKPKIKKSSTQKASKTNKPNKSKLLII